MAEKIDKEFYLTRGEYAKRIGKSKGSVIQNMRRGKLVNEYITRNGQYYFRDPQGVRAFKETVHGPMYTPKRRYNRGNHDRANYPNSAFREHNEMKRLAAIQYKVPKEIQDKIPKAIERIDQELKQQNSKAIMNTPTDAGLKSPFNRCYGGMLSQKEMQQWDYKPTNRGHDKKKKFYY